MNKDNELVLEFTDKPIEIDLEKYLDNLSVHDNKDQDKKVLDQLININYTKPKELEDKPDTR